MYRILFADDDAALRETTCDYLTAKGFSVDVAADGQAALEAVCANTYDLIILDVMMPRMDGLTAFREIRRYSGAPVLFLSALGQEEDLLRGFQLGADDYIVKPYPLSVLCEKCRSLLHLRKRQHAVEVLRVGPLTVVPAQKRVTVNGTEIQLTDRDFRMLLYLLQNRGAVLRREQILDRVWGADYDGSLRVVDSHVKSLRRALGDAAPLIRTVVNMGYRIE